MLCLQEIKLQDTHCDEELHELLGLGSDWSYAWNCSQEKKGYAGTAILSRSEPARCRGHGVGGGGGFRAARCGSPAQLMGLPVAATRQDQAPDHLPRHWAD